MWSFSVARAEIELKNDGFVTNGSVGFQVGFVTGEIGASRFVAPDPGRTLLRVQMLYGGSTASQTITLKVYDDTAGTDTPGAELSSADFMLTGTGAGTSQAIQELTLPDGGTVVPAQFRVGIVFQNNGLPSIARDDDGTIDNAKNYIFGIPGGWMKSSVAGLVGDWIIRACVSGSGGAPCDVGVPDGAGGPDAGITGGACNGNGECPTGQFCDLAAHACTFDCRVDDDCGGGTCNSLGQCVGGGGGGGCCRTDQGNGATGGALLGVGVLGALLVLRRRKTPA
jgi:MYXO-CTERM domain-containing protein